MPSLRAAHLCFSPSSMALTLSETTAQISVSEKSHISSSFARRACDTILSMYENRQPITLKWIKKKTILIGLLMATFLPMALIAQIAEQVDTLAIVNPLHPQDSR